MKPNLKASLLGLILTAHAAQATVRTVSNDPQSPGQFTSIAAAITAASNGDTIYIQGTNINYGGFSVNKSLTFIGSGHNPQNQNSSRSLVNTITLLAGSNSSKFYALVMLGNISSSAAISDVTVARNHISGSIYLSSTCPNWRVESNIFAATGQNMYGGNTGGTNNWYVVKNVFNGSIDYFIGSYNYFFNNLFLRNAQSFIGMSNCYVYNNIFYRAVPSLSISASVFERNLSYQCTNNSFPNGTNLIGQDPQFVSFPLAGASFSLTHNYRLQGTSPCIDYGIDAEDIGLYGGSMGYYEQNGIPSIPQLREFNITSATTVPVGGTVNISVKSTIRP
ncbi:MAG: hypothetical protein K9J06_02780 [Flavobacteriales bacterium]|nr:hypothetical protein [Flavobacteriales bacterium]